MRNQSLEEAVSGQKVAYLAKAGVRRGTRKSKVAWLLVYGKYRVGDELGKRDIFRGAQDYNFGEDKPVVLEVVPKLIDPATMVEVEDITRVRDSKQEKNNTVFYIFDRQEDGSWKASSRESPGSFGQWSECSISPPLDRLEQAFQPIAAKLGVNLGGTYNARRLIEKAIAEEQPQPVGKGKDVLGNFYLGSFEENFPSGLATLKRKIEVYQTSSGRTILLKPQVNP